MTLLPAVREQIDVAARERVRVRASAPTRPLIPQWARISLGAAAAVLAVSLALLFASWTGPQPRSETASVTPLGTVELVAPATSARPQAANELQWQLGLSETIP